MQAFIVRPFGTKSGINFDDVHAKLIAPALITAEIVGDTTASIFEAGNIREDMFQLLLLADLVIADISIHNANVFYELGIRHALRARQTFLIRAKVTKPREQREPEDEVPFDIKTDRYLEYDHTDPVATLDSLVQGLKETKVSNRTDSPVFRSLPRLEEPEHSKLTPVPLDFANDVEYAAGNNQRGKLGLLAWEAGKYLWEIGGLRLVGRKQFDISALVPARETWQKVRSIYPDDLEANLLLGTIYQRLGDLLRSDTSVQSVLAHPAADLAQRAEALALLGRNEKSRGRDEWVGQDQASRRVTTIRSKFFFSAWDYYEQAFQQNLNHYYSGLNALSLATAILDLIIEERDTWLQTFDSDDEAVLREKQMKASRDRLAAAVGMSLTATRARLKQGENDPWLTISDADYMFLTASRDTAVAAAYQRALEGARPFHVSAARLQLEIFRDLHLRTQRVNACLAVFPPAAPPAVPIQQAILFTGHMIDAPNRSEPRFPASQEGKARQAIREAVQQLLDATPGPAVGIAGGASGGDTLFHEVCAELGVPTRLLLTLPPGPFIAESVAPAGPDWVRRFNQLVTSHTDAVQILGETKELPRWMGELRDYDVWQRTNIWLLQEGLATGARSVVLVALWDGKSGDGPGGTKHLVELAPRHGVTTVPLYTTAVFMTTTG